MNRKESDFDIEATTINFKDNYIEQQYAPITDFRRKHKRDSKCNRKKKRIIRHHWPYPTTFILLPFTI